MEYIKALYFYPSPPTLVICVMVLRHNNSLIAIICTCAVSRLLLARLIQKVSTVSLLKKSS